MERMDTLVPKKLLRRLAQVESITRALRAELPAPLAAHVWFAAFREDGTAVLVTDDACWATALRFEQRRVLEAIRKLGRVDCPGIRIRVSPQPIPLHGPG